MYAGMHFDADYSAAGRECCSVAVTGYEEV
jgi:hypothetical protein